MTEVAARPVPVISEVYNSAINTFITNLLTNASSWASAVNTDLTASINSVYGIGVAGDTKLTSQLTSDFPVGFVSSSTVNGVTTVHTPVLPTVVSLGTVADLPLPSLSLAPFTGLTAPSLGDLSTSGLLASGTTAMWNEGTWANLKTQLAQFTNFVANSDSVLGTVSQLSSDAAAQHVAMYAEEYERKLQTLKDLFSAADASAGARGFSFPNSLNYALKIDAQQRFQFEMSEVARKVLVHTFEWAKQNWQFSMQHQIAAHNSDVEFNTKLMDLSIKVYVAKVNALMEKYRNDVLALAQQTEIGVKQYLAQWQVAEQRFLAIKKEQLSLAEYGLKEASANAAIRHAEMTARIDAFKTQIGAFLKKFETDVQANDLKAREQIAAADTGVKAATALASTVSNIQINSGTAATP